MSRSVETERAGEALLRAIPSWDDIRFFLAMQRAGSLSAAAGPLGVTQPTCGRRLAALESALKVRLFDRVPEGLRLTATGASLLEAATAMERGAQELALRAAVKEGDLDGVVRIATNELFASSFLAGALSQIRQRYSGLRFELTLSNADADLLRREADLAIRFRPKGNQLGSPALIARKLGDEPFLLYGADAYIRRRGAPSNPDHLEDHEVVAVSGRHPARAWCEGAYSRATVALSVSSMQAAAAAIAAGAGLGALPSRAASSFPGLVALSPPVAYATGFLLVHPDLQHVPRIRVVLDALAAIFRGDSAA